MDDVAMSEQQAPQVLGYATPVQFQQDVFWRDRKYVVSPKNVRFPARCIKCNAVTDLKIWRRRLHWNHPACFLPLLLCWPGFLIAIVMAMFWRGSSLAMPLLCREHRRKRRKHLLISWSIALLGVGILVLGLRWSESREWRRSEIPRVLSIGGSIMIGTGMILGMIGAHVLHIHWCKGPYVWYRGAGEPFLASLPPFGSQDPSVNRGFEVITTQ